MDTGAFRERQSQWARFNAWELGQSLALPSLEAAWAWYEEMWKLARDAGAFTSQVSIDPEKIHQLAAVRARLALL